MRNLAFFLSFLSCLFGQTIHASPHLKEVSHLSNHIDSGCILEQYLQHRLSLGLGVGLSFYFHDFKQNFALNVGKKSLRDGSSAPDHQTLYEVGSHTKAFVGVLLGEMVARGEINLEQKAIDLIPQQAQLPQGSEHITIKQLATHSSGLPRDLDGYDPDLEQQSNIAVADRIRPHLAGVYQYLSQQELLFEPGQGFAYSNLGFFVLGNILERVSGMKFEDLIKVRVFKPLDLSCTLFFASELENHANIARPHSFGLQETDFMVPFYTQIIKNQGPFAGEFDLINYFGGIISSMEDLKKWLAANQNPNLKTSLGKGMVLAQQLHYSNSEREMGLGWQLFNVEGKRAIQHGGDTQGSKSRIGFILGGQAKWALLANSDHEVRDIPLHLIDPLNERLIDFEIPNEAIELDEETLSDVVGTYLYMGNPYFIIRRNNSGLTLEDALEKKGVIRDLYLLADGFLYATFEGHKMRIKYAENKKIIGLDYMLNSQKSILLPKDKLN